MKKPGSLRIVEVVGCLDEAGAHLRAVRMVAEMMAACQDLRGSVVVEAGLIGDVGSQLLEELAQVAGALERLNEAVNRGAGR